MTPTVTGARYPGDKTSQRDGHDHSYLDRRRDNDASNASDWSPTGVPQPGDDRFITGSSTAQLPMAPSISLATTSQAIPLTAGSVPTHSIVTINLSHDATLNLATLVQGIVVTTT